MTALGRRPVAEHNDSKPHSWEFALMLVITGLTAAVLLVVVGPTPAFGVLALPAIWFAVKNSPTDEVGLLIAFTLVLFFVPARLIISQIGGIGTPAMFFSLVLGMLWIHGQLLPDQQMNSTTSPVRRAILAFVAANLFAFVAASLRATSGLERSAADRGAFTIAAVAGVTLFALDSIRSRKRLGLLLEYVVLGAAVSATIGILQFTTGFDIAARIRIPGFQSQVSDLTFISARSGFRRVSGTALHAIEFSVLLVMVLPLAIHFTRFGPAARQKYHKVALLLIGIALPMSLSRTGVVGLVVVLLVLAPSWEPAFRRRAFAKGAVFLVAMRFAFPGLLGTIRSLFTSFFVDSSVNDRRSDYGFIADFIAERPVFGRGFFTFLPEIYDFIDNQFLMSFVETGLIGLIAYCAVFLTPMITCIGLGRRARGELRPVAEAEENRDLAFSLAAAIAVIPAASATFDFLSFSSARVLAFFLIGLSGAFWRLEKARQAEFAPMILSAPRPSRPAPAPTVLPDEIPLAVIPPDDPPPDEDSTVAHDDLSGLGSGLRWSVVNQIVLRFGTFGSGIVLARLLIPEDFGVFAAGLAILNLLMSVNDLGLILGVVRYKGDPAEAARTAWTMSTSASVVLFLGAFFSAPTLANVMGTPGATGVIRLMAVMVIIDGLAAVPSSLLSRAFQQGRIAVGELLGLVASVGVSIYLAVEGYGAWSLAWGQVAGNGVTLIVLFFLAQPLPRPGYDPAVARRLATFGIPLALSTLVEQGVLNADYVIIGAVLGVKPLGIYLLAFNISSWPISVITRAVRRVSIVAFSKLSEQRDRLTESFVNTLSVMIGLGALVAILLSTLAGAVVETVYGAKWLDAATPLRLLALLGVVRVAVMYMFDLMIGDGRSRTVLRLQTLWLLVLVPALLVGTYTDGTRGTAIAHLAVTSIVVLPLFVLALRPSGIRPGPVMAAWIRPAAASVPAFLTTLGVASLVDHPALEVLLAGSAGFVVFVAAWVPSNSSLRWVADQRQGNQT